MREAFNDGLIEAAAALSACSVVLDEAVLVTPRGIPPMPNGADTADAIAGVAYVVRGVIGKIESLIE